MMRWMVKRWKSRIGSSLAILHAVALTGLIFAKPPLPPPAPCLPDAPCFDRWHTNFAGVSIIAGRAFHWHEETPLLQCLMLADLPGQLVGAVVMIPLWFGLKALGCSALSLSYVIALHWIFFGSLQWWLIGAIARRFSSEVRQ